MTIKALIGLLAVVTAIIAFMILSYVVQKVVSLPMTPYQSVSGLIALSVMAIAILLSGIGVAKSLKGTLTVKSAFLIHIPGLGLSAVAGLLSTSNFQGKFLGVLSLCVVTFIVVNMLMLLKAYFASKPKK